MSTPQREHEPILTESAGITSARQSLDNVLSAKTNLEQTSSWQEDSADLENKCCALDLQIIELEGMLAEIVDERFARMIDESQPDDENRNMGLLNFIIDTADSILASLLPASNTPPPTYQKHHQSGSPNHKPKVEMKDTSFPLPQDPSKRRRSLRALFKRKSKVPKADYPTSTDAGSPFMHSVPAKSTNNKLVGSSKPSSPSNPFRSSGGVLKSREESQDLSIDDLSLSAFDALKDSDAFKALLNHTENKNTSEIDRDNLWFSFREAFGNNLSKELLCAYDVLIRVSFFESLSKVVKNFGSVDLDEPGPGVNDKGKAPLRSASSSVGPPNSRSPSPSIDSNFVTTESPDSSPPSQRTSSKSSTIPKTSSQPPPYSHHIPTKAEPASCVICGDPQVIHASDPILEAPCGHVFCSICAEWLVEEYVHDESFHRLRCRCNEPIPKVDIERFISGWKNEEQQLPLLSLFRDKYEEYDVPFSVRHEA